MSSGSQEPDESDISESNSANNFTGAAISFPASCQQTYVLNSESNDLPEVGETSPVKERIMGDMASDILTEYDGCAEYIPNSDELYQEESQTKAAHVNINPEPTESDSSDTNMNESGLSKSTHEGSTGQVSNEIAGNDNARNLNVDYGDVLDCRTVFREEITKLTKETDNYRAVCTKQRYEAKRRLGEQKRKCHTELRKYQQQIQEDRLSVNPNIASSATSSPEPCAVVDRRMTMKRLLRKQRLLDGNQAVLDKEDVLADRLRELQDYKLQLDETELFLNRRSQLYDKRQVDLVSMHEELVQLDGELDKSRKELGVKGLLPDSEDVNSDKGYAFQRRKWENGWRDMEDRQRELETTVQKYRTQLASASAVITAKDLAIVQLEEQTQNLMSERQSQEQRIKMLDARLSMALAEVRKHTDKSGNSNNNNTNNNNNNNSNNNNDTSDQIDGKTENPQGSFRNRLLRQGSRASSFVREDSGNAKTVGTGKFGGIVRQTSGFFYRRAFAAEAEKSASGMETDKPFGNSATCVVM